MMESHWHFLCLSVFLILCLSYFVSDTVSLVLCLWYCVSDTVSLIHFLILISMSQQMIGSEEAASVSVDGTQEGFLFLHSEYFLII